VKLYYSIGEVAEMMNVNFAHSLLGERVWFAQTQEKR
jgi:hypothetical protein